MTLKYPNLLFKLQWVQVSKYIHVAL